MQISARQFPHPVLSKFSDDVIKCEFQTSLKYTILKTSFRFEISCSLSNKDLRLLIDQKKACYAVHFECGSTRYRSIIKSYEETFSIDIPADELKNKVQVNAFIIATENIDNYSSAYFHPDYESISFVIFKGDILAVDDGRVITVNKDIDPFRSITSIFRVGRDPLLNDAAMDVIFDSRFIQIKLSPTAHDNYMALHRSKSIPTTLASLVVIPALVKVLEEVKNSKNPAEDFGDRRWFHVLSKKLELININISDPETFPDSSVLLAQKLIGNPLESALKALVNYDSDSADDD